MKKLFALLKQLLLLPWRMLTWIREVLANLILLAVIVIILVVVFAKEKSVGIPQKGALLIAPSGALVERLSYQDPFVMLLNDEDQPDEETSVHDVVMAIDHAVADAHVTALVIDAGWLQAADPSKLFSIGDAITRFKQSGKPVFAVSDHYSQAQYLLASYADEIYLHPMGSVFLTGFGAYPSFFKEALDSLKVSVHVFRVGDYKSFVEPFVRNDMSEESRQNMALWLGDIWQQVTARIEAQRKLDAGYVDHYINNLDTHLAAVEGDAARMALQAGLVDKIATREEMKRLIMAKIGANDEGDSFPVVDFDKYLKIAQGSSKQTGARVGVIVASGTILDGKQPAGNIGGDSLAQQIKAARDDDRIKALVLRIDSPGGSAFASEVIRAEVALTQKAGIPVIASFGGVAASGGYWIASTADEIWATPSTITGSIGVFGLIPTFDQSLGAIGIHSDGVGTTALADAWHLDRPMNAILAQSTQMEVEHTYRQFIALAAEGRKSTPEKIHAIAQGQVWSGSKAKALGLVDHLGDLQEAIAAAADKAKLGKTYRWEILEETLSPREQFIRDLLSEARAWIGSSSTTHASADPLNRLLVAVKRQLNELVFYNDPRGVYVRCLECGIK